MTIDEIIEKINGLLDKVQGKLEELANKVNGILSHVPFFLQWAVDKFMDLWNTMLDKLGEFWDWFTEKLAYAGDPFGLGDAGERWNTDLGLITKALADQIDDEHELLVDDNWTGTAASAYKEQVPEQEDALRTLGQFATNVHSAMGTLKAGIITFWGAIVTALVGLAVAIVIATAAAGTVIGLPAAPVAVVAGVIAFLLAAGTGVAVLYLLADSAAGTFRDARQYATDWPDFAVS